MSPINPAAYLADQTHRALIDRLETVHLNAGHDLRTTIIEHLGDAGIWPIKCLEDRLEDRRRRRQIPFDSVSGAPAGDDNDECDS